MEAESEIISTQIIKPSSSNPHHLKDFKLSFFDQWLTCYYIPLLLFYSASDVSGYATGFTSLCDKLKASLSDVLTLYYPFCGRIKGNSYVDCNDEGVLFKEARTSSHLTTILENPHANVLKQLLPTDPYKSAFGGVNYEEMPLMQVQVTELSCGSVVLGLCISHKVADGATVATFLNAWVEAAKESGNPTKPHMEASLLFPTREMDYIIIPARFNNTELVTARVVFDGTSLSKLRSEMNGHNPTRVEAVTALLWKSMIEAKLASSKGQKLEKFLATHAVNIRGRLDPPLPEHSVGNVILFAATSLLEIQEDESVELEELAMTARKAITSFDADFVSKVVGDAGFDKFKESVKKMLPSEGIYLTNFTSWTSFPVYEADFGWGKPTWVSVVCFPKTDTVLFMPTKCGKGIEAWLNLDEQNMVEFERNPKLLQYALVSRTRA